MPRLNTPLTKLLNVHVPIILPPMAGAAGGKLVAAVTKGGGFAFVAAGHSSLSNLVSEIDIARTALSLSQKEPLPFGIGVLLWRIESPHGDPSVSSAFLETIVAAQPAAIWLSFGQEVKEFIERIRVLEKKRGGKRSLIFVMVGSVERAVEVAKWGVDVIVGQGTESGGHGPSHQTGLPLIALLPAIKAAFSSLPNPPLLVGAGGIATGSQLISLLPHASGAVIGTAFLPSPESLYSQAQKNLVVEIGGEDTVRSENFDLARGTLGWGEGVDGRGFKNLTVGLEKEVAGSAEVMREYAEAASQGDLSKAVTWSGTSVGLVRDQLPAEDVVRRIEEEALASLEEISLLRSKL